MLPNWTAEDTAAYADMNEAADKLDRLISHAVSARHPWTPSADVLSHLRAARDAIWSAERVMEDERNLYG